MTCNYPTSLRVLHPFPSALVEFPPFPFLVAIFLVVPLFIRPVAHAR